MNFIQTIIDNIDSQLQAFAFGSYQNLTDTYQPALFLMMVLYIIFWGYRLIGGKEGLSSGEIVSRFILLTASYFISVNFSFFSEVIYNFCTNTPDQLASVIINGSLTHASQTSIDALNQMYSKGTEVVAHLFNHISLSSISLTLLGIILYLVTLLMTAVALIFIIASKILLALCLSMTPIFAILFIYDSTRPIFSGWCQVIVTAMITPLIIYGMIAILYSCEAQLITDVAKKADLNFSDVGAYTVLNILSLGLFVMAGQISSRIGGGIHIALHDSISFTDQKIRNFLRLSN